VAVHEDEIRKLWRELSVLERIALAAQRDELATQNFSAQLSIADAILSQYVTAPASPAVRAGRGQPSTPPDSGGDAAGAPWLGSESIAVASNHLLEERRLFYLKLKYPTLPSRPISLPCSLSRS
jgi:hypothetical protein